MDAFIYIAGRLPCGPDVLEDALTSALGDRGEVTGTGAGAAGSNLDVLIDDKALSAEQALRLIRQALAPWGLPATTRIVLDGRESCLDDDPGPGSPGS